MSSEAPDLESKKCARTTSGFVGKAGDRVFARIDPAQAHFFDTKSGASLDIRLGD